MIERQQICEALARLDPREREVLDYSLHRRVPDADLATIFETTASDVARQRAAAIERLSTDLGAQRGADLGHILKELLEGSTWEAVPTAAAASAPAAPADEPPRETVAPQREAPQGEPSQEPDVDAPPPVADPPVSDAPVPAASTPQAASAPAAPTPEPPAPEGQAQGHRPLGAMPGESGGEQPRTEQREPVLGMLSGSERSAPQRTPGRRGLAALAVAIAVLLPAGVVYALTASSDQTASGQAGSATQDFSPAARDAGEPFPSDPKSAGEYPVAQVTRRTALYDEPNGRIKLRVSPKTEWDSPRVLGIAERRGRWLGVLVPELKNGQRAWVRDDKVARIGAVSWSLHADLSKKVIRVEHAGKTVRKVRIGVGRVGHSTPTGRFAVTDKLKVSDPGSPYGCCVLALTGHQTHLPPGWPGGDRLAVHATQDLSGLGKRVSLGCMRTDPRDTSWLLKRLPLGTPVFIKS